MFEIVIKTFKNYGETVRNAKAKKERECKEAHANYINTRLSSELARINEEFTQTCLNAKLQASEIIEKEFSMISEKVEQVMNKPFDPEFTTTLAVLKALKEPTRAELEAIIGKYKSNYFCYRAICDALGGRVKGFKAVTLDEIRLEVAEAKGKTKKALDSDVNEYTFMIFERGTALEPYNVVITDFIEGNFDKATEGLNTVNLK